MQVLRQRLAAEDTPGPLLLPVAAVLAEANERLAAEEPTAPPLTTGAVAHAFGGRQGLAKEVLRHALGPAVAGSDLLEATASVRTDDADAALKVLAERDHVNMTEVNLAFTRQWLLTLAMSPNDRELTKVTTSVYRAFDQQLIPLYQELAHSQGRRLADNVDWEELAAAMTTVTEGVAIRNLGDRVARARTREWTVRFRRILWDGMTQPECTGGTGVNSA